MNCPLCGVESNSLELMLRHNALDPLSLSYSGTLRSWNCKDLIEGCIREHKEIGCGVSGMRRSKKVA